MPTSIEIPKKCHECRKYSRPITHGKCTFCQTLAFQEGILCDLNRRVQHPENFVCFAFAPTLKLVGSSKQDELCAPNGSKMFIAVAILGSIYVSGYLMFTGDDKIWSLFEPYKINGNYMRNIFVLSCMIIYFFRLLFTLFVFFQRKMYWIEAIVIANIMPWIFPLLRISPVLTPLESLRYTKSI